MWTGPRFLCLALICVLAGPTHAEAAAPGIPDTPAGHAFGAWLEAINGDRAQQESYLRAHPSWLNLEGIAEWSADTGGYQLLEVSSNEPTNVFFHVRQRRWAVEEVGRMHVSATPAAALQWLEVRRLPSGARFDPVTLDAATRAGVVDRTARLLAAFHVDPAIGKSLSTALRKRAARGEYRALRYGDELARKLTEDLRALGHDQHLEVRFRYFVEPVGVPAKNADDEARRLAAANCGFEKAEHLRPNIAYLKFDFFGEPEICAATASAAMNFMADSDALIVDLRDNNGGRVAMVTFIATYLFAGPTHLSDGFQRAGNVTTESWTLPYVPGKRFVDKPVFVLISKRTFSAGEGLAYVLKDLKRATLVGETTVGGSGTIEFKPIDAHFTVVVPTGRVLSPITKTDWAGTGVEPDVKVTAEGALDAARKLAAAAIAKRTPTSNESR
jgi:hypothetical protein